MDKERDMLFFNKCNLSALANCYRERRKTLPGVLLLENNHLQVGNSNSALCPASLRHPFCVADYSTITTHPVVFYSLYVFWIGCVESNEVTGQL